MYALPWQGIYLYPILSKCFIHILPENVRKSLVFRVYRNELKIG